MSLFSKIYLKFFVKSGFPYAGYLKEKGDLHSQGENCFISKAANIPDPYLLSIGDNVWITSGCQILCHDASVIMINIMRTGHLDRVGPIIIGSNSFLGNNVIVLSNTRIGSNAIIGAGSVVTRDIPDNSVHAGNPARFVCTFDEYLEKIESDTQRYPWRDLLKKHETHVFDPRLEERLKRERVKYFFRERIGGRG
jgi:acetyltransferase-like isoleucine patch superfamily enzyme